MKKIILLFAAMFCFSISYAQHFAWAKKASTTAGGVRASSIATDAAGNSYATGSFEGTATFGAFTLTATAVWDIYIAKYDPSGTVLWAKKAGGTGYDLGTGIEIDANGDVIVTGQFQDTGIFDTYTFSTPNPGYKMFLAKYNQAGVIQWAKEYIATGSSQGLNPNKIAVDQFGNSFVTGTNYGVAHFGTDSVTTLGLGNIFTTKFDVNGNPVWVRGAGGYIASFAYDNGISVTVDSSGNVYTGGRFSSDTAYFGSIYVLNSDPSEAHSDGYLAKYNSSGTIQWVTTTSAATSNNWNQDIDVDKYGNIYTTGIISDVTNFGNSISLTPVALGDMFIAKYNTSGLCQWATETTSSDDDDEGDVITVDKFDRIHMMGYFIGNITLGDYTMASDVSADGDIYVAEYDLNGNFHWVQQINGPDWQGGTGIASGNTGTVFVTGRFIAATTFGSITLSSAGQSSFVAKMDILTAGAVPSPVCGGSTFSLPYTSTATFAAGNIFTAEISDSAGSFLAPVSIGTLSSASSSGTISVTIPPTTTIGTNFHIRVNSSNPAITGDFTGSFAVHPAPATQNICLVTVDTTSNFNIIDWEKPVDRTGLDSFRIYREVTTGVYSHIASVSADTSTLSEYQDMGANPNVTSYKYKIAILDSCGNENTRSLYHSTIHLQVLGGGNLQWTLYDIESSPNPVVFYKVYRNDVPGTTTWAPISTTIPGGNTTYTDLAYASFPLADYRMEVAWSITCSPNKTLINTTRSNIKHQNLSTGISQESLNEETNVYPNPSTNEVNVEVSEMIREASVTIYNALGQKVYAEMISGNGVSRTTKHIDLENYTKGIYTISIESNGTKVFKKLVVN